MDLSTLFRHTNIRVENLLPATLSQNWTLSSYLYDISAYQSVHLIFICKWANIINISNVAPVSAQKFSYASLYIMVRGSKRVLDLINCFLILPFTFKNHPWRIKSSVFCSKDIKNCWIKMQFPQCPFLHKNILFWSKPWAEKQLKFGQIHVKGRKTATRGKKLFVTCKGSNTQCLFWHGDNFRQEWWGNQVSRGVTVRGVEAATLMFFPKTRQLSP